MTLEARFERVVASLGLPPGPALVAVSGGPDSLALLDLLVGSPAARGLALHVAHADHGIHPASAAVAEAVRQAAQRHGLPVHVEQLGLGAAASETTARAARYQWLTRLADALDADLIFTAHHQDDQVETILMRVFKGSGPAGLAGMALRRGRLVRPLLPFRREELAEHMRGREYLTWDDPANQDPRHVRSWLRTEVLPVLRRRIPDLERRILALGRQAAAQRLGWDQLLERLPGIDLQRTCDEVSVAASPLHGYDSSVLRALLGALGRRAGCLIGPSRAARLERLLAGGRSGAVAELGSGFAAELSFGRLRLFRSPSIPAVWEPVRLSGAEGRLELGGWVFAWRREQAPERLDRNAGSSWFIEDSYWLRPWRPGDRIRPLGGTGRRLVVRCMQDARIARSRRAAWPILESAGGPVWVPGVCRSAEQVPAPGALALRIDAQLR